MASTRMVGGVSAPTGPRSLLSLAVWLALVSAALLPATVRADEHATPGECAGGTVGILNLTAEEAGTLALIAVCVLGAVGLLCLVLCATTFGYRTQVGLLERHIRSLEAAAALEAGAAATESDEKPPASPPSTVVYADPAGDELPPPPPEDDEDSVEDMKQPLPQTEVDVEPEPQGGEVNEGYGDEDVEAALTNMDAAVEEDPTDA